MHQQNGEPFLDTPGDITSSAAGPSAAIPPFPCADNRNIETVRVLQSNQIATATGASRAQAGLPLGTQFDMNSKAESDRRKSPSIASS